MTKETNSREIVLDVLLEILENGSYSHLVLKQALDKYQYLEKQDRAFITRVSEGTVEYLILLDAVINRFSKVKVKKMKPVIRTILRMSVYQILYMERVPDSAVCNEAVKLAKKRRFDGLSGFVNGVLRTVSREKAGLSFEDPSVRYCMPDWILSMWEADYGKERAWAIAASFLSERRLSVRCNLSLASKEKILESLRCQGISVTESPLNSRILYLKNFDYLEQVEAFLNGWLCVQDPSSSLVGQIASPKEGDFVLDVCSAPGGKTMDLADRLHGTGAVEARDLTDYKTSMVEENLFRCGFSNVRTKVWDARIFDDKLEGTADILLADLPCSGLGIIGKKPDIRLRITPKELSSLVSLQREILSSIWRYVKPGGTLIYSTCTINRKENEENASWITGNLPFREKPIGELLPEALRKDCKGNRIQLLPGIHPCDGFFIAAFERE